MFGWIRRLTKGRQFRYALSASNFLLDDEHCPEGVSLEVWNIVSGRMRNALTATVQAGRDGRFSDVAVSLGIFLADIQLLERLVNVHRSKEKVRNDRPTTGKPHVIR